MLNHIALAAVLSVGIVGETTAIRIVAPDYATRNVLAQQFVLARNFLFSCPALKPKYKDNLRDLETVTLVGLPEKNTELCGLCSPDFNTIFLFADGFFGQPGCYDNLFLTIAHELLHLAGMPPHKSYKHMWDYLLNDPIELKMAECINIYCQLNGDTNEDIYYKSMCPMQGPVRRPHKEQKRQGLPKLPPRLEHLQDLPPPAEQTGH